VVVDQEHLEHAGSFIMSNDSHLLSNIIRIAETMGVEPKPDDNDPTSRGPAAQRRYPGSPIDQVPLCRRRRSEQRRAIDETGGSLEGERTSAAAKPVGPPA
jgi:hypothetical protein